MRTRKFSGRFTLQSYKSTARKCIRKCVAIRPIDFQKSPSSDFIWRGTKDFSYLIGANFTDPKTGRCAWTNQSSSQGPLGIKLSLTSTKRIKSVTCGSNSNMGSMKDQVSNLNSRGIRASYVGDDCSEEQLEDILNLKEKIVFGSPRRSTTITDTFFVT